MNNHRKINHTSIIQLECYFNASLSQAIKTIEDFNKLCLDLFISEIENRIFKNIQYKIQGKILVAYQKVDETTISIIIPS
jgi:hypothetical protein